MSLRSSYLCWQLAEVRRRRASGEKGKIVLKVSREQLMTWTEDFVNTFNYRENEGMTNILIPCLTKLGQNIYTEETKPYDEWIDSLNANALYKALLRAHTASDLYFAYESLFVGNKKLSIVFR